MIDRHKRWLILILLVAFFLRVAYLGSKSVWLDEAYSVWQANRTPSEIWNETNDNHPPLYNFLLKAWMNLGESETIIRAPSVFSSMIGLALLYLLGIRLFNARAALTAVALMAIAPIDLWYAQEARMVLFVVPAALLIALGLFKMGWIGSALIAVGLAVGLYLDFTIIPLWVILSSIWFVSWWVGNRPFSEVGAWLLASILAWFIFLPKWSHLYMVASRMSDIYIFENVREFTGLPGFGIALPLLGLLFLALGTIGFIRWAPDIIDRTWIGPVVVISFIILFFLSTALVPLPRVYSVKRVVVTGWPLIVLGMSWLILRWVKRPGMVILLLILVSLIASLINLLAVPKDDWRGAVTLINESASPEDTVWLDPFSGNLPYNYYEPAHSPYFSHELLEAPPETEIWHIAERQPGNKIPGSAAEEWLDTNRKLLEVYPLYRLEVRHYSAAK